MLPTRTDFIELEAQILNFSHFCNILPKSIKISKSYTGHGEKYSYCRQLQQGGN